MADTYQNFRLVVPEDYWPYFRCKGVTAIIRLNRPVGTLSQVWEIFS